VVRTVPRGGQELTERLAERLAIELHEAEALKRENGLHGPNKNANDVLVDGVRPLMAEIRSSIHYFASTNSSAQLQRISLTGGGAALGGIAEMLTDQLGIPTGVVEPMQHIRNRWASKQVQQKGSDVSATAVSVGLGMGAAA
jgi:type IV pilus assembly protein PilM